MKFLSVLGLSPPRVSHRIMNSRRAQKTGPEVAGSCFRFPAEVNMLECQAQMQEALVAFSHTKS